VTGTYAPTAFSTNIPFPAPAPSGPYLTNFNNLIGISPNGTWSLYVYDNEVVDYGSINNGWILTLSSLNVLAPTVDLIVGMTASANPSVAGSNLTYTITVTNCGPAPATGVYLTNILPPGVTVVSNLLQTNWFMPTNASNTIIYALGSLPTNTNATATLVILTPTNSSGTTITNTVTAGANEADAYTADNTASVVTTISNPTANLVVSLADSPDPIVVGNLLTYIITVTNNGPATAPNVLVTNYLPPGVILTNFPGGTQGTNLGLVTVTYGPVSIGNGGTTNYTIQVVPIVPGLITNIVGIGSDVVNPLQADNFASVKTQVIQVQLDMSVAGNSLSFSWSTNGSSGYRLQSTPSLSPPAWTTVPTSPGITNGQYMITVPLSGGAQFFRLIGTLP
jgi:uncharacterized repeat protein (TIGR01451 family)